MRDLTDAAQNAAALAGGSGDVAAEAAACARSRRLLEQVAEPLHLSVVWAMYAETGRLVPKSGHPHGEDLVREKVRQLDWLVRDLPVTWSILACDDGCPDDPSSAEVMARIVAEEGYPASGHRSVRVMRLTEVMGGAATAWSVPAVSALTSTDDSRKGGSVLAALATMLSEPPPSSRHLACYTDADLSANLAQLGSLAAPIADGAVAALGQRYGVPEAVLVKPSGPVTEPHSTGDKPDKVIVLFRHAVRATLIPDLARVLDTQAGLKAFDATALAGVLPSMESADETFDVELLVRLAQRHGADALAVPPIVFTEDFAATNFPSVDPGARHLAMVRQVVDLYDRLVAPVAPATGEAADLLDLVRTLDLDGYVRLITRLRAEDVDDPTLFDRRWPAVHLRALATP